MKMVAEVSLANNPGDQALEKSPRIDAYSIPPAFIISIHSPYSGDAPYIPLNNLLVKGVYPDITGFKETMAPVCRLNWRDRIGLLNLSLFSGTLSRSSNPDKQKFYAQIQWDCWLWDFNVTHNKTDIYDLYSITKRSQVRERHKKNDSSRPPLKWQCGFGLTHTALLQVLPEFKNVAFPIKNCRVFNLKPGSQTLGEPKAAQRLFSVKLRGN